MVRRRSTVRFRNGAQVDYIIRKDSNGSWMPVGTNGCHQGTESPATASPERPYPQGIWDIRSSAGDPQIPSQPTDQSAGQARTGTLAVRSRDCLDASGDNPPGRSPGPYDGMPRRGQRQPGAAIMSAGRAPRIVSASIPASPTGPHRPATVTTAASRSGGVHQSRRAVPSRAGSAGVILRGWELITRPGCHQGPGQRKHCRWRSRSWTRPARGSAIRTSATG
jgi:hypothetical protein